MASTPGPGLILQHGPAGPPGVLGDWLRARGIAATVHRAWEDPLPRDPAAYAFVASLGSQHSPAGGGPSWVAEEVRFLRSAVDRDVPVLGLCFGGQALAAALGGAVRPAVRGEVGWLAVRTREPALVPEGPWLQFHWDVFDVPPAAEELARSGTGPAAFAAGPHLGVQFHPEATPEMVDAWARIERERLAALGTTPEALLAEGRAARERAAAGAHRLFDAWWARTGLP
ncbi:MAG TPA: gamma-glutamyl-gamma-aminobutyrate hydrolase family protein [Solirubrobacteraceae bacterium]|nr:gamma-glutamyl-gamma-aminobutyrate hydrolase family protein [Solirubrobacteraceae bacterium]